MWKYNFGENIFFGKGRRIWKEGRFGRKKGGFGKKKKKENLEDLLKILRLLGIKHASVVSHDFGVKASLSLPHEVVLASYLIN